LKLESSCHFVHHCSFITATGISKSQFPNRSTNNLTRIDGIVTASHEA
jgi:hypothetical protein